MSPYPLEIRDEASVALARTRTREVCASASLPEITCHEATTVASELAHNLLRHGRHGEFLATTIRRGETPGIELEASDRGEGLATPQRAFQQVTSTAGGLGIGLVTVRRLSHELDAVSRRYEGTTFNARFFAEPGPRRLELGAFGRPHPQERRSGDDVWYRRLDDELLIAVADGLGHGVEARQAAEHALAPVKHAAAGTALTSLLQLADTSCRDTRGAALTLLRVRGRSVEMVAAGNVAVRVASRRTGIRRFQGQQRVLGGAVYRRRQAPWRLRQLELGLHDTLLVYTDGVRDRFDPLTASHALALAPLALAGWLVEELGRSTDDALAVVVR